MNMVTRAHQALIEAPAQVLDQIREASKTFTVLDAASSHAADTALQQAKAVRRTATELGAMADEIGKLFERLRAPGERPKSAFEVVVSAVSGIAGRAVEVIGPELMDVFKQAISGLPEMAAEARARLAGGAAAAGADDAPVAPAVPPEFEALALVYNQMPPAARRVLPFVTFLESFGKAEKAKG